MTELRKTPFNSPIASPLLRGYTPLKRLAPSTETYLCREHATERLIVMKFFDGQRESEFKREAKALSALQSYSWAPRLHFAVELAKRDVDSYLENSDAPCGGLFALALEYFCGKPLSQAATYKFAHSTPNCLTTEHYRSDSDHIDDHKRQILAEKLTATVRELHDQGWTHGDISPNNILWRFKGTMVEVKLIDWEFAQKIREHNTSSYGSYRGTVGYQCNEASLELQKRDERALHTLLASLGGPYAKQIRNTFVQDSTQQSLLTRLWHGMSGR